jgi:hypothetical protein
MPEDQSAAVTHQEPGLVQPPQRRQVDAQCRQHPIVQSVWRGGRELEHLEVVRGDTGRACQHGVPDRAGQRKVRVFRDLGDEERVATGHRVHPLGVQPAVRQ